MLDGCPASHTHRFTHCRYIPNDTFAEDTAQYRWLKQELAATDRAVYPWVIVNFHAPWYTTYVNHYQENEAMRQVCEDGVRVCSCLKR